MGVCAKLLQKHDRSMSAGKAKPRGLEKRASEPKGENQLDLGVGEGAVKKYVRSMLAGKAKPKGLEKRASDPKAANNDVAGVW